MRYYVLFTELDISEGSLDWKQFGKYNTLEEALFALMECVEADVVNGIEYVYRVKEVKI